MEALVRYSYNSRIKDITDLNVEVDIHDNMNFNDGSCCKSSDKPTSLQTIAFGTLYTGLVLSLIIIVYELICKRKPSHHM